MNEEQEDNLGLSGMLDQDTISQLESISRRNKCIWFQSPSIENMNKMYEQCYFKCNGYDTNCPNYQKINVEE